MIYIIVVLLIILVLANDTARGLLVVLLGLGVWLAIAGAALIGLFLGGLWLWSSIHAPPPPHEALNPSVQQNNFIKNDEPNNKKETVPPGEVYDLYIARHPTITDFKPEEPIERKTTRNDITFKHRDIKGDGHQAWYLYTTDFCGSGGCSGEIYIYENGKYCYAGDDEFDKFFNSDKIFPDLSCKDIKSSDIDALGNHSRNLRKKYRIE